MFWKCLPWLRQQGKTSRQAHGHGEKGNTGLRSKEGMLHTNAQAEINDTLSSLDITLPCAVAEASLSEQWLRFE